MPHEQSKLGPAGRYWKIKTSIGWMWVRDLSKKEKTFLAQRVRLDGTPRNEIVSGLIDGDLLAEHPAAMNLTYGELTKDLRE